jgi:glycosyltransferase involved in cell wall biosynthesis
MHSQPLSIAFIVRDPLPPLRADVLTLFGRSLPQHGIATELIGQAGAQAAHEASGTAGWAAGRMHVVGNIHSRWASVLTPLWDALGLLRACRRSTIDIVQVRDKVASGLVGRLAAVLLGVPFVYWMSFPIVEGYAVRRDAIGAQGRGLRWFAHALRATVSHAVLYRLVLPGARHIFVQSEAMADWLAGQGIARERMSAVPMGVDTEQFCRDSVAPSSDPRLDGRRVVLYLGRIAQSRKSGFLLELAEALRQHRPDIVLVIAGDAPSADEMAWMRAAIVARGLQEHVLLTGWLPQREALGYALRAEVGVSPIPRGMLFDVSSPTKLVEYLALGLAGVANDIPDQQLVIERSQAGLAAPMEAEPFAQAVLRLLGDDSLRAACAARGPGWVRGERSYEVLAVSVARAYAAIVPALAGRIVRAS